MSMTAAACEGVGDGGHERRAAPLRPRRWPCARYPPVIPFLFFLLARDYATSWLLSGVSSPGSSSAYHRVAPGQGSHSSPSSCICDAGTAVWHPRHRPGAVATVDKNLDKISESPMALSTAQTSCLWQRNSGSGAKE